MDSGHPIAAATPEPAGGVGASATAVALVLVVFGCLLLARELYPAAAWPQTAVVIVVELISASVWAIALYVGTIVMLAAIPGLLGLGVGLLVAATIRAVTGEGFGWEALVGALLVALGATCLMDPPVGGPFVPVVMVAVGAALLLRRRAPARIAAEPDPLSRPRR